MIELLSITAAQFLCLPKRAISEYFDRIGVFNSNLAEMQMSVRTRDGNYVNS